MPYLGTKGLKASDIRRFNVTGSTSATHTLTWVAPTEQSLIVTINGVKQQEDAYSVSGTTLTLTSALIVTDKMEVVGINDVGTTVTPAQNSVNLDKLATTGTASSSTFLRGDMAWTAVSDTSGLASAQVFTSSGTWTRPTGITKVMVEVLGAGGGGRRMDGSPYNGQSGGAGAYTKTILDVSSISSATITIGSGGSAGGNNVDGGNGGFSSWADGTNTLTCNGGEGGLSTNIIKSAATASGSYDFYIEGQPAGRGTDQHGGSTIYGTGGIGGGTSTPVTRGYGYGSGGAGARLVAAQPGADGIVIVTEYK